MEKSGIYDPEVYQKFEAEYSYIFSVSMITRQTFGGVWAYYRSNAGSLEGIEFWENKLEEDTSKIHFFEIIELLEAFNLNRQLHRNHFKTKLDTLWKPFLLKDWKKGVSNS